MAGRRRLSRAPASASHRCICPRVSAHPCTTRSKVCSSTPCVAGRCRCQIARRSSASGGVNSISTSGHKYGLVYPGVGWVVWRSTAVLPESMIFHVSYLGGDMPTLALNFSRPGAQVLLQYYQFLRLGREGYREVQQNSIDVAW